MSAYGIDGEGYNRHNVEFALDIGGTEVSWALGAMVYEATLAEVSLRPVVPAQPKTAGTDTGTLVGIAAGSAVGGLMVGAIGGPLARLLRNITLCAPRGTVHRTFLTRASLPWPSWKGAVLYTRRRGQGYMGGSSDTAYALLDVELP